MIEDDLYKFLENNITEADELQISGGIDDIPLSKLYKVEKFSISNSYESKKYDRPIGEYRLINILDVKSITKTTRKKYIQVITTILRSLMSIQAGDEIIVVGLGNSEIEADSLGSLVANKIIVTRLSNNVELPRISSFVPSVMGVTGIETCDIVEGLVKIIKPKVVIIVDALCATSVTRLGTSIQITTAGLTPGGGINNAKKPLNKDTLGCDVVTIAVPTMIYAKDLCEHCNNISNDLVVTFHDVKIIVEYLSDIIASGINNALIGIENN